MPSSPAFTGLVPVLPRPLARASAPSAPRCAASDPSKHVLVINTKGGGHGVIGPHLAENLLSAGHRVSLRQVGPESTTGPFARYAAISAAYPDAFSLTYGAPDASAVPAGAFDAVYDNNSKAPEDAAAAMAAGAAGAELFYVSSAGAYAYDPNTAPHLSGDVAKGATITVEDAMRSAGVSSAVFRPIYVVGPGTANRQYHDFFFDRIVRGRKIPVPGHPSNLTSISDVRDLASMMAGALGKGFGDVVFNSVSPRCISVEGVVAMCAKAAGREAPELVAYDPKVAEGAVDGFVVKKAFPFRPRHFFADPFVDADTARKLDWDPAYSGSEAALEKVLADAFKDYVALGLDKREVDFSLDDKILEAVA